MSARTISLLIYAVCAAYVAYEAYTYTGLYRWVAEWEIAKFGGYSVKPTFLAVLLALSLPATLLVRLASGSRSTGKVAPPRPARRSSPATVFVIGLVCLAVGAGLGWYGYDRASHPPAIERFDLTNDASPKSSHVTIVGIVHPELIVTLEHRDSLGDSRPAEVQNIDRYIPLTPANWRKGDPLVYFMRTNIDAVVLPGGGLKSLRTGAPPFAMTTEPAILVPGDMPGPVAEVYRKNGVALAAQPVILDFSPVGGEQTLLIAAGVAFLIGLSCVLSALMGALFRPRLVRT